MKICFLALALAFCGCSARRAGSLRSPCRPGFWNPETRSCQQWHYCLENCRWDPTVTTE